MRISQVKPLTFNELYKVLSATHISAAQKEEFVRENRVEIDALMLGKINTEAFQTVMKNRPIKLFKPLRNSYTKAGDKKILAETLGIEPSQVPEFVNKVSEAIKDGKIKDFPKDKIENTKIYAYRHGTKEEVANFLDYELGTAQDVLGILYRTLSYNTGGVADYYVRPIHRMNNKTLVHLYDIIDKNLKDAKNTGNISETDRERTAEWALVRIYEIQNNQKLKNAIKLKRELNLN